MVSLINVGVLAYQGSVIEHYNSLSQIADVNPVYVKTEEDLNKVSGIILPGGESTTMGKLLRDFNLREPLIDRIKNGMPVWGTCAGMILLAKEITGGETAHLGVMNIEVKRNAYGSQLDSFNKLWDIPKISKEKFPVVFIRAPWVERVFGETEILSEIDGRIVGVRENNMIATSFHPELTDRIEFHEYFVNMIRNKV